MRLNRRSRVISRKADIRVKRSLNCGTAVRYHPPGFGDAAVVYDMTGMHGIKQTERRTHLLRAFGGEAGLDVHGRERLLQVFAGEWTGDSLAKRMSVRNPRPKDYVIVVMYADAQ